MKKLFTLFLLMINLFVFSQQTITVNANSEEIAYSLDLKVVAQLFAEASTTEQFEIMLNNPDSAYSNLDLNGDGNIDYLRVVEAGTADNKLIVIQAVLAKDIYQDVASIYVEKDPSTQEVSVQIIGDEYIYGKNYIIEPVYIYRPIIYNWFWSARWYCWESPYYWGYYPTWWYYHHCWTYDWYWHRCYRFHHHHHHCSFHHGHHHYNGYHNMHSGVSRRDYAERHPDNSFNRRHTDVKNAGQLRSGASVRHTDRNTQQHTAVRSTTNSTVSTSAQRTSTTQRTNTVQRTGQQPVQRSTTSTQRTSSSTQQRTTQHTSQPVRTTQSQPVQHRSSGSSTNTSSRSSGSVSRSSGTSAQRSSGSVQRSSGSAGRSSGGSSSRRR